jgi:hypothetical protein
VALVAVLNYRKKEAGKNLNRGISGGIKPPQNIGGKIFSKGEICGGFKNAANFRRQFFFLKFEKSRRK